MKSEFTVSTLLIISPEEAFAAWLDSDLHSRMTGSKAVVSSEINGKFEAWDGYISGTNLELEIGKRILQSWRTAEFTENEPDSNIELIFEPDGDGCKITLRHWDLPEHGAHYESGWEESYFTPMRAYFSI